MDEDRMSALLGRSLTAVETQNFKLYLKIAKESLSDLLCTDLCSNEDPRVFDGDEGYSTVFTDIFTEVEEVKVNGTVIDQSKYSPRQWDKRQAKWYNSVVFDYKLCRGDEVEISAFWGFGNKMPADLQLVLAGLFDLITKKNKFDGTIKSKRVEDFQITFDTEADLDEMFYSKFDQTINKYGLCSIDRFRQGRVWHGC